MTAEYGRRIQKARTEHGMSVMELAQKCNVSVASIQAYERADRVPRDEVKISIALALDTTVQALFF